MLDALTLHRSRDFFSFLFIELSDNFRNFGRSVFRSRQRFANESFSRSRSEWTRTLTFDLTGCNQRARSPLDRHRTGARDIILPSEEAKRRLYPAVRRDDDVIDADLHILRAAVRPLGEKERESEIAVAHGPAPSRKLAPAVGVNESNGPPPRAPLRFALFLLRAPESPTPRNPVVPLDPVSSLPPRSPCRDSPPPPPPVRVGLKSSSRSGLVIIGGHEIALQYVNNVAGLIVPPARETRRL